MFFLQHKKHDLTVKPTDLTNSYKRKNYSLQLVFFRYEIKSKEIVILCYQNSKNLMVRKLKIVFIIILNWTSVCGQNPEGKNWSGIDGIEGTYNDGIVMPHTESIEYLTKDFVKSFSIHVYKETNGEKLWQKVYHQPRLGVGFNFSTLGNKEVFGNAYSIYPFFEAPFLTINEKIQFNYRISFGLSYITETFELYENYQNIAISTNPSIYFNLMFNTDVKITNHTNLFGAVGFSHFSNGKIKSPNLGINTITSSLGIRYKINNPTSPEEAYDIPSVKNKNRLSVISSHGIKEHSRFVEGKFYISSLNLSFERRYAHWGQYGIGIDGFYDESKKIRIRLDPEKMQEEVSPYNFGAHLSHDFFVGDLALTLQLGHYFYKHQLSLNDFYNRVGLKYYFNNQFILNVTLKSHAANAEFIEFGLGYYIK